MKLDALRFGFATAIVAALSWAICGLFVWTVPGRMMMLRGNMMHENMAGAVWTLHWSGFLAGLVAWSIAAGLFAWALAAIYNRLLSGATK